MQQNWISLRDIGIYNLTQISPYAANEHKVFEANYPMKLTSKFHQFPNYCPIGPRKFYLDIPTVVYPKHDSRFLDRTQIKNKIYHFLQFLKFPLMNICETECNLTQMSPYAANEHKVFEANYPMKLTSKFHQFPNYCPTGPRKFYLDIPTVVYPKHDSRFLDRTQIKNKITTFFNS
jgi:hypothetical protein